MQKTQKLVLCALFTALTTIATMVIQIPLSVSGYINMGDVFVLFGAFMLGPLFGAVSAGVGSMLADILTGYVVFAPATLIIKAIMALVYFFLFTILLYNKRPTMLSTPIPLKINQRSCGLPISSTILTYSPAPRNEPIELPITP